MPATRTTKAAARTTKTMSATLSGSAGESLTSPSARAEAAVGEFVLATMDSAGGRKSAEEAYATEELSLQRRNLVSLGVSLLKFTHLKVLDLSRNKLESVDGIVRAPFAATLERLSLYYNAIKEPEEISLLAGLPQLTSLDLRLNPITRSKVYRVYVLGTLPQITRLDERDVGEFERRRAKRADITLSAWNINDDDDEDEGDNGSEFTAEIEVTKLDTLSVDAAALSPQKPSPAYASPIILDDGIGASVSEKLRRLAQSIKTFSENEGWRSIAAYVEGIQRDHEREMARHEEHLEEELANSSALRARAKTLERELDEMRRRVTDAETDAARAAEDREEIRTERAAADARALDMLREAHGALIESNRGLLRELHASKERHEQDTRVWERNFNELLQQVQSETST